MRIADMMASDGRVFIKSEWGPINDDWPCASFTRKSVGDRLRRDFVRGRDVLIYVGTSSPETTPQAQHRSRLLSAVVIEPTQTLETSKIVPPEKWSAAMDTYGGRWPYSMAIVSAADIVGPPYPNAHDVVPISYRSLADFANRGGFVEAIGAEREAVMSLTVNPLHLNLRESVVEYLRVRTIVSPDIDKSVKQEAFRMATLIYDRVKRGGEASVRVNPLRTAPNISDLVALMIRKWQECEGKCSLCSGHLIAGTTNSMLQASVDRIDSSNGAYDDSNVHLTHLACNLAKNKFGLREFEDWIAVLRGVNFH